MKMMTTAKIISKEKCYIENPLNEIGLPAPPVPVWGYGVEADDYETAKALATQAFKNDSKKDFYKNLIEPIF